jgi:hypothetical protein
MALILAVSSSRRAVSFASFVAVSAMTLSITVTNWMAGLAVTMVAQPLKRAMQISLAAFLLVVALSGLQKLIFPSAQFFFLNGEDSHYLYLVKPFSVTVSFLFHSVVMPAIELAPIVGQTALVTQLSLPGSASLSGQAAVVLWASLLLLGTWSMFACEHAARLRIVVGMTILGQFALHLLYGEETFLYALHFMPLLVVMAAISTLTPARPVTLMIAAILLPCLVINNVAQFHAAKNLYAKVMESRGHVRQLNQYVIDR